jgi:hypothetical protein
MKSNKSVAPSLAQGLRKGHQLCNSILTRLDHCQKILLFLKILGLTFDDESFDFLKLFGDVPRLFLDGRGFHA